MKAIGYFAVLCGLAMTAGPAFSQNQNMGSMPGMNMSDMNMQNMNGMHMMSATVTAIDNATGLTDVDAGGMKLRVHFQTLRTTTIMLSRRLPARPMPSCFEWRQRAESDRVQARYRPCDPWVRQNGTIQRALCYPRGKLRRAAGHYDDDMIIQENQPATPWSMNLVKASPLRHQV
jgi:hypothetical protein